MFTLHFHLGVYRGASTRNCLFGGGLSGVDNTGDGLSGVDTSGVVDGDALCRFAWSIRFRIAQNRLAPSIISGVGFHCGGGVFGSSSSFA